MRVICAWCGKEKVDENTWVMPAVKPDPEKEILSHGICRDCAIKAFGDTIDDEPEPE